MSAPPFPLEGERKQLHGPLYSYSIDIEPRDSDSYMPSKMSFWNSSEDTQYRITFEFVEFNEMRILDSDKVKQMDNGGKFQILLYPGAATIAIEGSFASYRMQMQFGTPDRAWLEQQAVAERKDTQAEIDGVRYLCRKYPSADGKFTADYIASLCEAYQFPFVNLTFPPKDQSLARDWEQNPVAGKILLWKRPATYIPEESTAGLFVGTIEPGDIDQGFLGSCYLLCSFAGLAERPQLIEDLFNAPRNPSLGIYRVIMCKNGWRHVVTVDDLVPTEAGKPIFAKNRNEPNEMWCSLLEKVYAQLHGSYAAIAGGAPSHAVADLQGKPYLRLRDLPDWETDEKATVFEAMEKADRDGDIITLSTPGSDTSDYAGGGSGDQRDLAARYEEAGLVTGHAFTVLQVKYYNGERLVQIRNPWGGEREWNGRWGDSSPVWTAQAKRDLGWTAEADGTFWMAWPDVWRWFDGGALNRMLTNWSCVRVAGNYDDGIPDVVMRVTVAPGSAPVTCYMGLHQGDPRGKREEGGRRHEYVAVLLAAVTHNDDRRQRGYSVIHGQSGESFMAARDVFMEVELAPCDDVSKPYYLVPLCYSADANISFVSSLWFSSHAQVSVEFVSYREGHSDRCMHPANFKVAEVSQKVSASIQIETPQMRGRWVAQDAHYVDWALMPADIPTRDELQLLADKAAVLAAHQRVAELAETGNAEQMFPIRPTVKAGAPRQGSGGGNGVAARIANAAAQPPPEVVQQQQQQQQQPPPQRQQPPPPQQQPQLQRPQPAAQQPAAPSQRPPPLPAMPVPGGGAASSGGGMPPGRRPQHADPNTLPGPTALRPAGSAVMTPTPGPRVQNISVTIVSGSGLAARDVDGSSDPYCNVALLGPNGVPYPGKVHSTSYESSTLDPVWGEAFTIEAVQPHDVFEFSVFDKDFLGSDEFMGSVKIPVASLGLDPASRRSRKMEAGLTGDSPRPLPFLPPITFVPSMGEVTGELTLVFKI